MFFVFVFFTGVPSAFSALLLGLGFDFFVNCFFDDGFFDFPFFTPPFAFLALMSSRGVPSESWSTFFQTSSHGMWNGLISAVPCTTASQKFSDFRKTFSIWSTSLFINSLASASSS